MRSLLDVNVLIALFVPDHVHHEDAHKWWSAHKASGWASCPLTQNGFVRVISQPSFPGHISTAAAITLLRQQVDGTNHAFWADDVSILDAQAFDDARVLGPKQVTDAYLLGLAVEHRGRLATFDDAISIHAVHGAKASHVAAVSRHR